MSLRNSTPNRMISTFFSGFLVLYFFCTKILNKKRNQKPSSPIINRPLLLSFVDTHSLQFRTSTRPGFILIVTTCGNIVWGGFDDLMVSIKNQLRQILALSIYLFFCDIVLQFINQILTKSSTKIYHSLSQHNTEWNERTNIKESSIGNRCNVFEFCHLVCRQTDHIVELRLNEKSSKWY